jgi:hypothetical protein
VIRLNPTHPAKEHNHMQDDARIEPIDNVLARLTPDSNVTVGRSKGHVLVDDKLVADFGIPAVPGTGPMEDYADTLWTCVQDLQFARAGWPC